MRSISNFIFALIIFSSPLISQTSLQPLQPGGNIPDFFHCPSQQSAEDKIEARKRSGNPMSEQEEQFTREMSYYAQQRVFTGLVLFNDSLSNYVTKVAKVLLKNDTVLFNQLHFYVYKDPALNAYTSATGNILFTVGLLAQIENEAQLAFILAHEITHFKEHHMLKGYINREELKKEGPSYSWSASYYSYNQEQELEADRLGFELYKTSPYAISDAKRCFDILEYSDLPFDDMPFDTLFFNKDYMKVPVGYYKNEVDPVYTDDNYEDRSSTHPNVRKRRMALLATMDSVPETGRVHFYNSKQEFLNIRESARYEMCRLLLAQRDYSAAIYSSYMMLQKHPGDLELRKIIGYSLYNLAAYKQSGNAAFSFWGYYFNGSSSRYGGLKRSSYYSTPNYEDYPGEQQQVYHLFSKMEADEMTVMALSYNWYLYRDDPADSLQSRLCDSLFSMLVNKQNLHRSYFSTISPAAAQEELRQDSIRRAQETGEVGDSKYSRLDKFRVTSEKERFIKFSLVELMKDTNFVTRFDYQTQHRKSLVYNGGNTTYDETKIEREQRLADEKKYGAGVKKVMIVNPDYTYYHEPDRKEDPEMEYPKSETGQVELCTIVDQAAQSEGVDAIVLSPFLMDSLDTDTFSDYALLNEWFYERVQYGTNPYATNVSNKAAIDSLIVRYGTPYVMFTNVEASYLKRIQHPVWYAVSCLFVVPIVYGFIPRHEFVYDAVVLDLRTGQVVQMEDETKKRGKEKEHCVTFYKNFFGKLKRPVKPADPKPVAPAGLRD